MRVLSTTTTYPSNGLPDLHTWRGNLWIWLNFGAATGSQTRACHGGTGRLICKTSRSLPFFGSGLILKPTRLEARLLSPIQRGQRTGSLIAATPCTVWCALQILSARYRFNCPEPVAKLSWTVTMSRPNYSAVLDSRYGIVVTGITI